MSLITPQSSMISTTSKQQSTTGSTSEGEKKRKKFSSAKYAFISFYMWGVISNRHMNSVVFSFLFLRLFSKIFDCFFFIALSVTHFLVYSELNFWIFMAFCGVNRINMQSWITEFTIKLKWFIPILLVWLLFLCWWRIFWLNFIILFEFCVRVFFNESIEPNRTENETKGNMCVCLTHSHSMNFDSSIAIYQWMTNTCTISPTEWASKWNFLTQMLDNSRKSQTLV